MIGNNYTKFLSEFSVSLKLKPTGPCWFFDKIPLKTSQLACLALQQPRLLTHWQPPGDWQSCEHGSPKASRALAPWQPPRPTVLVLGFPGSLTMEQSAKQTVPESAIPGSPPGCLPGLPVALWWKILKMLLFILNWNKNKFQNPLQNGITNFHPALVRTPAWEH